MSVLNVVSNRPGAGKTCLAAALSRLGVAAGKKVACYKPRSANPESDPDLAFLRSLLADAGSPQESVPDPVSSPLAPDNLAAGLTESQVREVAAVIGQLEAEFDRVLVEWETPEAPAGQPTLLVFGWPGMETPAEVFGSLVEQCQSLGSDLAGALINGVPRHRNREAAEEVVAPLRAQGWPVLGAIPEDREMLALTLGQVAYFLGGRWVEEPENSEDWIDRFLIGGNIMDSGPNYFGRYSNQAVITRAARPDIQLASLMCDTRLLVLTGGEEPTEYIRVEAQKRNASLLLVSEGTLEVADALGGILALADPYAEHKLARFTALSEQHLEGGLHGIFA